MMLTRRIQNRGRKLLAMMLSVLLVLSLGFTCFPLTGRAEDGIGECTVTITLTSGETEADASIYESAYLKGTDNSEVTYPLTEKTATLPAGTYVIYLNENDMIQDVELTIAADGESEFNIRYFTILFMDGETELSKQYVAENGKLIPPEVPLKDGFTWNGWTLTEGSNEVANLPLSVTSDLIFYTVWHENPTEPPAHEHVYDTEWKFDETDHWHECTAEGDCDARIADKVPHNFDNGTVTKEATETTEGEISFKCTDCGFVKTESIRKLVPPPHEHDYDTAWKSDETNHWHECIAEGDCDARETEKLPHNFDDGKITKEPTEATEGEKTYTCTDCEYQKTEPVDKLPHEHKYETEWKADGTSHWHECVCGNKNETAPHKAGEWIVDKKATVTTTGSRHKECTICKKVLQTENTAKLEQPKITAGAGQIYRLGSGKTLTITASRDTDDLTGVYVDNKIVSKDNYILSDDGASLTFKALYLDTLSSGNHTVKLAYQDGTYAETQFSVQKAGAVKTGDNSNFIPLIILLILAAGVMIVTSIVRRKYSIK